jgi:streptomycin 6-kinase
VRVRLPDVVRARAEALGAPGRGWIAGLDAEAAALARRWDLTLLEQLTGGTAAVVLRARDATGRDVVLKLAVPDGDLPLQADTLRRAAGRGDAGLLAADLDRHALLLEALGPPLAGEGRPPEDQLRILCDVLAEAWSVPPADGQRPLDKAGQLYELVSGLWRDTAPPCGRQVLEHALSCAEARTADPPSRPVVVHGDAAPANCLRVPVPRPGAAAGHAFVDPDGFLGDPAYDLGVALRDWIPELMRGDAVATMRRWVDLVCARTGADPRAVGQWAFLERVSTGLVVLSLGQAEVAAGFLRTAEALLPAAGR